MKKYFNLANILASISLTISIWAVVIAKDAAKTGASLSVQEEQLTSMSQNLGVARRQLEKLTASENDDRRQLVELSDLNEKTNNVLFSLHAEIYQLSKIADRSTKQLGLMSIQRQNYKLDSINSYRIDSLALGADIVDLNRRFRTFAVYFNPQKYSPDSIAILVLRETTYARERLEYHRKSNSYLRVNTKPMRAINAYLSALYRHASAVALLYTQNHTVAEFVNFCNSVPAAVFEKSPYMNLYPLDQFIYENE